VKEGCIFESVKINDSFTETIRSDYSASKGYDISEIPCTSENKEGVAFCQWKIKNNGDSDSFVATKKTICRYGWDSLTEPECPYPACLDL
jgi:hypothetical protein